MSNMATCKLKADHQAGAGQSLLEGQAKRDSNDSLLGVTQVIVKPGSCTRTIASPKVYIIATKSKSVCILAILLDGTS